MGKFTAKDATSAKGNGPQRTHGAQRENWRNLSFAFSANFRIAIPYADFKSFKAE